VSAAILSFARGIARGYNASCEAKYKPYARLDRLAQA